MAGILAHPNQSPFDWVAPDHLDHHGSWLFSTGTVHASAHPWKPNGRGLILAWVTKRCRSILEPWGSYSSVEGMPKLGSVTLGIWLILAGAAQAQIKIGIAGPLSGPDKAYGAQFKNGATQAIEDINGTGGLLGQKLVTELGDDQSDP